MMNAVKRLRISSACTACGSCIITCGPKALLPAPKRPHIVQNRCTFCGDCIDICPVDAIAEISADAISGIVQTESLRHSPSAQKRVEHNGR